MKRDTDRQRPKGHGIAWLVCEEPKNAPRSPCPQSDFRFKQAREWRFSMAGFARRGLGPHNRDSPALVVDNYFRIYAIPCLGFSSPAAVLKAAE